MKLCSSANWNLKNRHLFSCVYPVSLLGMFLKRKHRDRSVLQTTELFYLSAPCF